MYNEGGKDFEHRLAIVSEVFVSSWFALDNQGIKKQKSRCEHLEHFKTAQYRHVA